MFFSARARHCRAIALQKSFGSTQSISVGPLAAWNRHPRSLRCRPNGHLAKKRRRPRCRPSPQRWLPTSESPFARSSCDGSISRSIRKKRKSTNRAPLGSRRLLEAPCRATLSAPGAARASDAHRRSRRRVCRALCIAASTFHPPALAAQIDSSSPAAVAAISTDSAPARSRDGRFVEVTKQQAEALREAASKKKLPTPPPGSDLEQMLSAGGGGSTDPRAHAR